MPIVIAPNPTSLAQPAITAAALKFIGEYRRLNYYHTVVNLTDPVFRGVHHGRQKHDDDFDEVMNRSKAAGVKSMIITGTSLREVREVLTLAKQHNLYATVGCHPTRSSDFEKFGAGPTAYLAALDDLISKNMQGPGRVVAVGECGLDYDRLHFSDADTQRKYFRMQLSLAKKYHLPLFLHSRAAHKDLVTILREEGFGEDGGRKVGGRGGVIHSFTGSASEIEEVLDMGFYISLNGCSLKTAENLEVAKAIPIGRLMLETDAPWCSMTQSHASNKQLGTLPPTLKSLFFPPGKRPEHFIKGQTVKGRNEPCAIGGVAWVIHKLQAVPYEVIVAEAWKNTVEVFGLQELEQ